MQPNIESQANEDLDYSSLSSFDPNKEQLDYSLSKTRRYVKDSICNQISFEEFYWNIIDTSEFQ